MEGPAEGGNPSQLPSTNVRAARNSVYSQFIITRRRKVHRSRGRRCGFRRRPPVSFGLIFSAPPTTPTLATAITGPMPAPAPTPLPSCRRAQAGARRCSARSRPARCGSIRPGTCRARADPPSLHDNRHIAQPDRHLPRQPVAGHHQRRRRRFRSRRCRDAQRQQSNHQHHASLRRRRHLFPPQRPRQQYRHQFRTRVRSTWL